MAPIHITFMLACHCSPDPEENLGHAHWNSPAGYSTREWLVNNELLEPIYTDPTAPGNKYTVTDRGRAWVEFICSTPLPVIEWRLPDREAA